MCWHDIAAVCCPVSSSTKHPHPSTPSDEPDSQPACAHQTFSSMHQHSTLQPQLIFLYLMTLYNLIITVAVTADKLAQTALCTVVQRNMDSEAVIKIDRNEYICNKTAQ